MQGNPSAYDVFVSYTGVDSRFAEKVASQFESETIDGTEQGRRLRAFLDKWDIAGSPNIVHSLNQGLAQARHVVLVMSPEFFERGWTEAEWTSQLMVDPLNLSRRLILCLVRDVSIDGSRGFEPPPLLVALNRFDFRRARSFAQEFKRILRVVRGEPPLRGKPRQPLGMIPQDPRTLAPSAPTGSFQPDSTDDLLLGNLLPVASRPGILWSAAVALKPWEIAKRCPEAPPFHVHDKRIWTFADLKNSVNPLHQVIAGSDPQSHDIGAWRENPDRRLLVMTLFNRCLEKQLPDYVRCDKKGRFFFIPELVDGKLVDRKEYLGDGKPIAVAAHKVGRNGASDFWVHRGAWITFMALGESLFLRIEPCYVFTSDGLHSLGGKSVGQLSVRWTGKERNAAVLRQVMFWSRFLRRGSQNIAIGTGGKAISVRSVPATASADFGIEGDHIALRSLLAHFANDLEIAASQVVGEGEGEDGNKEEHSDG